MYSMCRLSWPVKLIDTPTFSHGLEVHFSTEAAKSSDSPSPNLKDVDGSGLQASYDCSVGLTPR